MTITVTRTAVVKGLSELFWYAIIADGTPPSIITARSVIQRVSVLTGNTNVSTLLASRGAGHLPDSSNKGYAVALTAIRSAMTVTVSGGGEYTFAAGDPPGTALVNLTDAAEVLGGTIVVASATAGDQFAIVEQPPTYSGGLISYISAVSQESPDLRRDIRDKGQMQHRKRMSVENGVMTFTALYENAKAGLSQYIDQDFIMIGEREDDRVGVVTEKVILYGARINSIPTPNESAGDSDTDTSFAVNYELLAVVGETGA